MTTATSIVMTLLDCQVRFSLLLLGAARDPISSPLGLVEPLLKASSPTDNVDLSDGLSLDFVATAQATHALLYCIALSGVA